jgi:hypothetical protein
MKNLFVSCFCLVLFGMSTALGQAGPAPTTPAEEYIPATTLPPGCEAALRVIRLAKQARNDPHQQLLNTTIRSVTSGNNFADCFAQILTVELPRSVVRIAKQSSNRQAGSTSGTSGTTSAVSQPFSLLSLASEYGGLTSSSNNGTFTVQTALNQIPSALAADHFIDICRSGAIQSHCIQERDLDIFHRFSIGATFNTSTSSKTVTITATGPLQGTTQQVRLTPHGNESPSLSSLTAKVVVWNEQADAQGSWAKDVTSSKEVTAAAQDLASKISELPDLSKNRQYAAWELCTIDAIKGASDTQLDWVFLRQFNQLHGILILKQPYHCDRNDEQIQTSAASIPASTADEQSAFVQKLGAVVDSLNSYNNNLVRLRESEKSPVLTFEYDWSEPQSQPTNSVFKLVLSKNFLDKAKKNNIWTVTANGAFSIYNSEPSSTIPGASHLRDVQAGAEVDRMLPKIPVLGQSTLSLAYYFQDQQSPSILKVTPSSPITGITFTGLPADASEVFAKKGDIHLAQLKWALGTGKNVRFPFAFSYSNRTDLIQKPDWRGQFGVSYDFSSFLSGQGNASK